jgi:hypothetical protein
LRIDALAARAHDAQGARVIVASEHVVLDEPEVFRAKTIEPAPILPLAGMVATSTGIYMVTDATGDVRPLNWAVFYLLNGPYIVVPVLAAIWLTARTRKPVTAATRTAC